MSEGPRRKDGCAPARLDAIETRWSVLKGPPRAALDHLCRTYGDALAAYLRGRLARGDFSPLRPDDADDLLQDFFLRLGETEWLAKPDRRRGRFRPFLLGRLVYFLRERRARALGRPRRAGEGEEEAALAALAAGDEVEARLDREWRAATVRLCLARVERRNAAWGRVLGADLRRDGRSDAALAADLALTLDAFRNALKRARAEFRRVYEVEESRLDGFGGDAFDGAP